MDRLASFGLGFIGLVRGAYISYNIYYIIYFIYNIYIYNIYRIYIYMYRIGFLYFCLNNSMLRLGVLAGC